MKMEIIKTIEELKSFLSSLDKHKNPMLNFVPTMGALHDGHLSLVKKAKLYDGLTIVSIFVNKSQFNSENDYINYPRVIDNDIRLLESVDCNVLFCPESNEMDQIETLSNFDTSEFDKYMEGLHRPGHFKGVAEIVFKLFSIINPDNSFFGIKDYQQCLLIEKLRDFYNFKTLLSFEDIVRESNGLAMSSRNLLLSEDEKTLSSNLFNCLMDIKANISSFTDNNSVLRFISNYTKNMNIEYLDIVEDGTMVPLSILDKSKKLRACICCRVNNVRLIDNLLLN